MLFDASNNQNHEIPLNGGRLDYYPSFLSVEDAQRLMQQLIQEINWGSEKFVIFGKTYESPRLIAWYGKRALIIPILVFNIVLSPLLKYCCR